jgi:hypothetical protein
MKKFSILLSGKKTYLAETEEQAIKYAEDDIKNIPNQFNIGVFAISEKGENK